MTMENIQKEAAASSPENDNLYNRLAQHVQDSKDFLASLAGWSGYSKFESDVANGKVDIANGAHTDWLYTLVNNTLGNGMEALPGRIRQARVANARKNILPEGIAAKLTAFQKGGPPRGYFTPEEEEWLSEKIAKAFEDFGKISEDYNTAMGSMAKTKNEGKIQAVRKKIQGVNARVQILDRMLRDPNYVPNPKAIPTYLPGAETLTTALKKDLSGLISKLPSEEGDKLVSELSDEILKQATAGSDAFKKVRLGETGLEQLAADMTSRVLYNGADPSIIIEGDISGHTDAPTPREIQELGDLISEVRSLQEKGVASKNEVFMNNASRKLSDWWFSGVEQTAAHDTDSWWFSLSSIPANAGASVAEKLDLLKRLFLASVHLSAFMQQGSEVQKAGFKKILRGVAEDIGSGTVHTKDALEKEVEDLAEHYGIDKDAGLHLSAHKNGATYKLLEDAYLKQLKSTNDPRTMTDAMEKLVGQANDLHIERSYLHASDEVYVDDDERLPLSVKNNPYLSKSHADAMEDLLSETPSKSRRINPYPVETAKDLAVRILKGYHVGSKKEEDTPAVGKSLDIQETVTYPEKLWEGLAGFVHSFPVTFNRYKQGLQHILQKIPYRVPDLNDLLKEHTNNINGSLAEYITKTYESALPELQKGSMDEEDLKNLSMDIVDMASSQLSGLITSSDMTAAAKATESALVRDPRVSAPKEEFVAALKSLQAVSKDPGTPEYKAALRAADTKYRECRDSLIKYLKVKEADSDVKAHYIASKLMAEIVKTVPITQASGAQGSYEPPAVRIQKSPGMQSMSAATSKVLKAGAESLLKVPAKDSAEYLVPGNVLNSLRKKMRESDEVGPLRREFTFLEGIGSQLGEKADKAAVAFKNPDSRKKAIVAQAVAEATKQPTQELEALQEKKKTIQDGMILSKYNKDGGSLGTDLQSTLKAWEETTLRYVDYKWSEFANKSQQETYTGAIKSLYPEEKRKEIKSKLSGDLSPEQVEEITNSVSADVKKVPHGGITDVVFNAQLEDYQEEARKLIILKRLSTGNIKGKKHTPEDLAKVNEEIAKAEEAIKDAKKSAEDKIQEDFAKNPITGFWEEVEGESSASFNNILEEIKPTLAALKSNAIAIPVQDDIFWPRASMQALVLLIKDATKGWKGSVLGEVRKYLLSDIEAAAEDKWWEFSKTTLQNVQHLEKAESATYKSFMDKVYTLIQARDDKSLADLINSQAHGAAFASATETKLGYEIVAAAMAVHLSTYDPVADTVEGAKKNFLRSVRDFKTAISSSLPSTMPGDVKVDLHEVLGTGGRSHEKLIPSKGTGEEARKKEEEENRRVRSKPWIRNLGEGTDVGDLKGLFRAVPDPNIREQLEEDLPTPLHKKIIQRHLVSKGLLDDQGTMEGPKKFAQVDKISTLKKYYNEIKDNHDFRMLLSGKSKLLPGMNLYGIKTAAGFYDKRDFTGMELSEVALKDLEDLGTSIMENPIYKTVNEVLADSSSWQNGEDPTYYDFFRALAEKHIKATEHFDKLFDDMDKLMKVEKIYDDQKKEFERMVPSTLNQFFKSLSNKGKEYSESLGKVISGKATPRKTRR